MRDARDLTVHDLAAIVDGMDKLPVEGREYRRLNDQISAAALTLENCGVLARLISAISDLEPDPPPGEKARLFVMPIR